MRTEDRLLCLGIFIGFGFTVAAMALPLWYPNAPQWMWGVMFFGGLAVAAYSSLFLVYELLIKPRLSREVKLVPLIMIIGGILLIIGGIIYHLHDKIPQVAEISTPSQPTAEEIAIAKKLPINKPIASAGNLKQRATVISDDILEDLFTHGWMPKSYPKDRKGFAIIGQMPPDNAGWESHKEWQHRRSEFFKWKFYKEVLALKDEFAQSHLKDQHLDSIFEQQVIFEGVKNQLPEPHQADIWPPDIEYIAEQLKIFANQIKN